jgi:primosomal protein N' (replication factor Y) (superfamily II helicase)
MPDRHARCAAVATRVGVLLPLPLEGAYDYEAPPDAAVAPGDFVAVPLGKRTLAGVVWGEAKGDVAPKKLKRIAERLPAPPMPAELRRFIDWVASYTLSPPGAVLRMAMSVPDALLPSRGVTAFALAAAGREALHSGGDSARAPARARVLALLADGPPLSAAELARQAACGAGVVRALAKRGLIEPVTLPRRLPPPAPDLKRTGPWFSPEQQEAADALVKTVQAGGFSTTLLDGVTGSGKTEVYFAAIAAALGRGRQVLVLLPEIALSTQWLARFAERFGAPPTEWHSDLGTAARRAAWRHVADGEARVVVGARSALFLPFHDLGLIIVDEEQDSSFKQEDGVVYQARDMAVVRASIARIPLILVSATPSLETVVNVRQGRYRHLHLPSRHGAARLPEIRVIDMRRTKLERQRFLSTELAAALASTFEAKEQAMLFLNRRGYAPLTLCRNCGHRMQCPHCTAWLVEHRFTGVLQCHHCGYAERIPSHCPECGAPSSLAPCGPGVERLAEEAAARFPAARLAVMASDTLTSPSAIAALMQDIEEHRIDVLIGTQVVAKGHHFPLLTLVGVVDADLGLSGGDLRAAERTYQLLHQVAGRAGRAERPGIVYLQTYMPEHPVIEALVAGDRDRFLEAEAEAREAQGMPPFGRLAALIISGGSAESADFAASAFARAAPHLPGVETWGPAPAPLMVLRERHRRRFLVKAKRGVNLQAVLRQWLGRVKVAGDVRVQVDVDPYSFL